MLYLTYLCILLVFLTTQAAETNVDTTTCKIKCGIIDQRRGTSTLFGFVQSVWGELSSTRSLSNVVIDFVRIQARQEMTMDLLVEAYMEIGTRNVSAIIGPYMQTIATAAEKFGAPYFVIEPMTSSYFRPYNLITVFPKPMDLYRIAIDIVKKYEWREVAIFYENEEGAQLVEDLVLIPEIRVRSWKVHNGISRELLRSNLLYIRQLPLTNIVLMANRQLTNRVLDEALKLSMLSKRYAWVIPSLNQDEVDLMGYAYTDVNLTTFHLVQSKETSGEVRVGDGKFTQFEYATVYDSLLTLYHAVRINSAATGKCQLTGKEYLISTLQKIKETGATGDLSFHTDGTRRGYIVNVLTLGPEGLVKIGSWSSSVVNETQRLIINDTSTWFERRLEYPIGKEVVKVVTILEPPFVQLKPDYQIRYGNDRFEGYCIDLLQAIAAMLDFKYEIYLVPDGQFGDRLPSGEWNGLVGELLAGNASMAVASLTITSQREEVIDFSKPFKTLGISILMKRPIQTQSFFQFLDPLSPIVWMLLVIVLLFISLVLYVVDRIAPAQNTNIRFSAHESIWFTFSSMVLSGTDVIPRTISGRILAGSLWFFSLIIISSYTANLAAFLTISKINTPIQNVADLVAQTKVQYGTVRSSQVSQFFQNSRLLHFQQMWQFMSSVDPNNMVANSDEGLQKVKQSPPSNDPDGGGYAFLWDSPVIKHLTNRECDLMEVGQPFDSKGYGIGVPLGASFRDDITMAILKLSEAGDLSSMSHRWWKTGQCAAFSSTQVSGTQSLTMGKVAGVFVVLSVGMILGLAVAVLEYTYRTHQKQAKNRNRKIIEKNNTPASKSLCDGHLSNALQVEEPFLANSSFTSPSTAKQTNIF